MLHEGLKGSLQEDGSGAAGDRKKLWAGEKLEVEGKTGDHHGLELLHSK